MLSGPVLPCKEFDRTQFVQLGSCLYRVSLVIAGGSVCLPWCQARAELTAKSASGSSRVISEQRKMLALDCFRPYLIVVLWALPEQTFRKRQGILQQLMSRSLIPFLPVSCFAVASIAIVQSMS